METQKIDIVAKRLKNKDYYFSVYWGKFSDTQKPQLLLDINKSPKNQGEDNFRKQVVKASDYPIQADYIEVKTWEMTKPKKKGVDARFKNEPTFLNTILLKNKEVEPKATKQTLTGLGNIQGLEPFGGLGGILGNQVKVDTLQNELKRVEEVKNELKEKLKKEETIKEKYLEKIENLKDKYSTQIENLKERLIEEKDKKDEIIRNLKDTNYNNVTELRREIARLVSDNVSKKSINEKAEILLGIAGNIAATKLGVDKNMLMGFVGLSEDELKGLQTAQPQQPTKAIPEVEFEEYNQNLTEKQKQAIAIKTQILEWIELIIDQNNEEQAMVILSNFYFIFQFIIKSPDNINEITNYIKNKTVGTSTDYNANRSIIEQRQQEIREKKEDINQ